LLRHAAAAKSSRFIVDLILRWPRSGPRRMRPRRRGLHPSRLGA